MKTRFLFILTIAVLGVALSGGPATPGDPQLKQAVFFVH